MKLPRRTFLHLAASAAALPAPSLIAWAQAYPTRPVRIIAPAAAGTAMDVHGRLHFGLVTLVASDYRWVRASARDGPP